MHVLINTKQFLGHFKALTPLAVSRFQRPILETLQLEVTPEGQGVLRATNLDADLSLEVPLLKVHRGGTVQLPLAVARALQDAKTSSVELEGFAPETLPFMADPARPCRRVALRTTSGVVTLQTFDPQHFPPQVVGPTTADIELRAWRLTRLIERTRYAVDEDSTRYALGGCAFEYEDGTLRAIATDGRRLALACEAATGTRLLPPACVGGDKERPLVPAVPAKALATLATVLATRENALLTLGFTADARFQVQSSGLLFTARLLEGRFPAWRAVFPPPSAVAARIDQPDRLGKLLKEAQRYTRKDSRGVELRLLRHMLTIVVENDWASTTREMVVRTLSQHPEEEARVTIDPAFLLDYLAVQRQAFTLWFPPEKGQAMRLESEGFEYLLMPMERPDEASESGASPATDQPPRHEHEESPAAEARSA
jgi:DNA polymerase III subunit beta